MAFMPAMSSKEFKELLLKKSQFYVEFLGWMECRGLRGERYTEPVIRELKRRQRKVKDTPPKLTIQVSKKELKISQEVEDKKKRGSIKKIKFPSIPGRDVTFVQQAVRSGDGRPEDIVACIYLGYMPRTGRYVHVHVYRFDSPSTASAFSAQMGAIAASNMDHMIEVERTLAAKGEIEAPNFGQPMVVETGPRRLTEDSAVGSASSGYSGDDDIDEEVIDGDAQLFASASKTIDPDVQSLHDVQPFDNVADELRMRLKIHEKPLLLPPKDYDTISRAHGNLQNVSERRCLNLNIVGDLAFQSKERNGSNESGVDLASPGSASNKTGGTATPDAVSPSAVSPSSSHSFHEKDGSSEADSNSQASYGSGHRRQGSAHGQSASALNSPNGTGVYPSTPVLPHEDLVYPPRASGSPLIAGSRPVWPTGPNNAQLYLQRQGSFPNSDGSGSNSGAHISDPDRGHHEPGRPLSHQPSSNGDIYAVPSKLGPRGRPHEQGIQREDVPPADYGMDNIQFRGMPRNNARSQGLVNSMPERLIRSEMGLIGPGPIGRSMSSGNHGDPVAMHGYGRVDSPTFGPAFAGVRSNSPSTFGSNFRVDSPVNRRSDPRMDDIYNGGRNSPRVLRVGSGKR